MIFYKCVFITFRNIEKKRTVKKANKFCENVLLIWYLWAIATKQSYLREDSKVEYIVPLLSGTVSSFPFKK
jgi:hypothetical protein